MVGTEKTNTEWLMEWMENAPAEHPVRDFFDATDGAARAMVDSFGSIIGDLERVSPKRLDGKRSYFYRLPSDEFNSFRSELVVAAQLARSGAEFEFGELGHPQPDLVMVDKSFGIEIKTRTLDGLDNLCKELTKALSEIEPKVNIKLIFPERLLNIRREDREQIVKETLKLAQSTGKNKFYVLERPWSSSPTLRIEIVVESAPDTISQSQLSIETGALLTPYLKDIEDEIWKVLEDDQKRNQAASMNTILLVDITLTGKPGFRSAHVWSDQLAGTFPEDCPFIGVGIVLQDLVSPRANIAVAFRSDCSDPIRKSIQALCDS